MREQKRKLALLSLSISMLLYGISITLGPLLTELPNIPKSYYIYLIVLPPLSLLSGNIVFGNISDRFGRKPVLVITPAVFGIGLAFFIIAKSWICYTVGVSLILFSIAGGDEPTIISYLAESEEPQKRGKAIIIASNFVNIGALLASSIFLTFASIGVEKAFISSILVFSLIISVIIRKSLPESSSWLESRNSKYNIKEGLNGTSVGFLVSIAISTVLTYGLISWVIGPYFFATYTSLIIFLYNAGNIAGGFIAYAIIERFSRNSFILSGFTGGFLTIVFTTIILLLSHIGIWIFLPLLIINGIFAEATWGTRLVLESELFPTKYRATSISLIRASAWIAYALSSVLIINFTIIELILYDLAFWLLGLSGSIAWYIKGKDTRNIPIEEIDKLILGS
ncbi:MAG: MFS transporter [Caldisphaeraceae archaeon]|nr:MFS transporter [Caldisphaeraceae archaeon]